VIVPRVAVRWRSDHIAVNRELLFHRDFALEFLGEVDPRAHHGKKSCPRL
jgi:hypothetical protein